MSVIPLTIVAGLCLVFTFLMFFLRMHACARVSSVERDSLLPFAEEGRAIATNDATSTRFAERSMVATRHPGPRSS
jgi:hypothetical protein